MSMQASIGSKKVMNKIVTLDMTGGKSARQRIWENIRALSSASLTEPEFNGEDIVAMAKVDTEVYHIYIQCLLAGGVVEKLTHGSRLKRTYRLLKDTGIEAPKLNRHGKASRSELGLEIVWRTLRIMGEIDALSLGQQASAAGVDLSPKAIHTYLDSLNKAGYLTIMVSQSKNVEPRFRLKPHMDTGPRPPQLQKMKALYDPNLNQIMYADDPQELL